MSAVDMLQYIKEVLYRAKSSVLTVREPKLIALGRRMNSTVDGKEFDSATVDRVWDKAFSEWGFFYFRKDIYSSSMAKHDFGKKTKYGWEIDHIIPVSRGGTDDISNLQPLHWKNNNLKGEHITIMMNGNGNGNGYHHGDESVISNGNDSGIITENGSIHQ